MKWLDYDNTVLDYSCEPFSILYEVDGQKKRYIPDFLITYNNGCVKLVEVKPMKFVLEDKTQCKIKAAKNYCKKHNYIFEVWSEEGIDVHE